MKRLKHAVILLLGLSMSFMASCTKDSDNGGNGNGNGGGNNGNTYNGHEYVDLGLPSGTLWATCNVGATTPEGYGDYFAWGETAPKPDSCSLWEYYKWFGNYDGFHVDVTKYYYFDNSTTLLPEDDAATANWGNGWCMPTVEQWKELYQYVNSTGTIQNGVFGRLFTSNNGRSLFLPATDLEYSDNGWYWTSSLSPYMDERAWCFVFSAALYGMNDEDRCKIFSVRPVRSTN